MMKKIFLISIASIIFLSGCTSSETDNSFRQFPTKAPSYENEVTKDYDYGYQWAEDNDIDNFDDCQDEFGTGDPEDGCNEYVKDNYTGDQTFHGYDCTEDCSGHQAGYKWAEENDIRDSYDCGGNSQSFNEGCEAYIEENY